MVMCNRLLMPAIITKQTESMHHGLGYQKSQLQLGQNGEASGTAERTSVETKVKQEYF